MASLEKRFFHKKGIRVTQGVDVSVYRFFLFPMKQRICPFV